MLLIRSGHKRLLQGSGILALALVLSCASVNSRIDEHRDEFTSYDSDTQLKLQNGDIEPGFTETMVYIAKGHPAEKTQRSSGGKLISVWRYGTSKPQEVRTNVPNSSDSLSGSFGYPEFGPRAAHHPPAHYQNRPRMEIEFENGRVKSWR
ncbi:MAG TPA: hypothetical protein PLH57_04900 [Oligoflexia bacterium]|nr:hypothetical protein [Oligoflexia bacterium]